jgi:CheY-like chemotaxis protein
MTAALPLFYFKPTICWVDDDQLFLDAANISFSQDYHCLIFNNPHTGLHYLNSYQAPLSSISFMREFTESDVFGTNNRYPVDVNLNHIKNIFHIENKSREMPVLIVDNNMPGMSGIELCHALKNLPIKKILLTGEKAPETVIDAFNHGVIDRFISKDHGFSDTLNRYVAELTRQYFYEKSCHLLSHIEASRPSLLSDALFMDFFHCWCLKNEIEEYYLINKQGSYLLKSKQGKLFCLAAMSEQDKMEFIKLNDELVDDAADLLNEVAKGKLLPFFGIEKESWDVDVSAWQSYFYPCEMIAGRENYYWAVVEMDSL